MDAPIFFVGTPRSGTSLISRIVGSHPRIAVPFESYLYKGFVPWRPHYGDLGERRDRARLAQDMLQSKRLREWIPRVDAEAALERKDLLEVAIALIDKKTAAFDASAFKDNYTVAMRELIKRKTKSRSSKKVTREDEEEPPRTEDNVIDLMAALKKRLEKAPSAKKKKKRTSSGSKKSSRKKKRA